MVGKFSNKSLKISVAVHVTDQSISALVSYAHDAMKNQIQDKPVMSHIFQLVSLSTATDSYSIYYQFFYMTEEEMA